MDRRYAGVNGQARLALLIGTALVALSTAAGFRVAAGDGAAPDPTTPREAVSREQLPPPMSPPVQVTENTSGTENSGPALATEEGDLSTTASPAVGRAASPAHHEAPAARPGAPSDLDVAAGDATASATPTASGTAVATPRPAATGTAVWPGQELIDTKPVQPPTGGEGPITNTMSAPRSKPTGTVSCASDPSAPGACALGARGGNASS